MGGDRDGNPFVTYLVTAHVVYLARWMAADLYLKEIDSLHFEVGDAYMAMKNITLPIRYLRCCEVLASPQLSMCQCSAEAWNLATSITRKNEAKAAAAEAVTSGGNSRSNSIRGSSGGGNPTPTGGAGSMNAGGLSGVLGSDAGMKRVSSNASLPPSGLRSSSSGSQLFSRGSVPGVSVSPTVKGSPLGSGPFHDVSQKSFVGQTAPPPSSKLHFISDSE